jgi:hypothetical protein
LGRIEGGREFIKDANSRRILVTQSGKVSVACKKFILNNWFTASGNSRLAKTQRYTHHEKEVPMRSLQVIMIICSALLLTGNPLAQKAAKPKVSNPALREELLKRVKQDQAIRDEMIKRGVDHLDKSVMARMAAIDADNTARMKKLIEQYGWPGPDLVGEDGTEAAFLLVQHAEYELQKQALPLVRAAYLAKKLSGQDYALLLDRVLVKEGKPQVYGTQAKPFDQWKDQEPVLEPVEDEANLDKRRAEVGLFPIAEYRKLLKAVYFPKNK